MEVLERQSEFLSPVELHDLTGSKPHRKQVAWLVENRVPHRVDGTRVIVSRVHARAWLEGQAATAVSSAGPAWGKVK